MVVENKPPYSNGNFPTSVKCDGCGECLDAGWMPMHEVKGAEATFNVVDDEKHYCDDCAEKLGRNRCEFRTCEQCGEVMTQGFCDGAYHVCEGCFTSWMNEVCPGGWRPNDEGDGLGGYYEELMDGEWHGTGIYWTRWD